MIPLHLNWFHLGKAFNFSFCILKIPGSFWNNENSSRDYFVHILSQFWEAFEKSLNGSYEIVSRWSQAAFMDKDGKSEFLAAF